MIKLPAVNRKILAIVTVAALAGAACSRGGPSVRAGEPPEGAFVVQVADFEANAGPGLAMTTDKDGNPHLVYLSLPEEPKKGEAVVPPAIGDPVPPFVKHAHYVGGAWTRSVVADEQNIDANVDQAAIAVDAQGVHHVAWTSGDAILYASNGPEGFAEPVEISSDYYSGLAIAVDSNGSPWLSFWDPAGVAVAGKTGEEWTEERVFEGRHEPGTTAIASSGDDVLVAYADGAGLMLARRAASGWTSEVADGDGGYSISIALDDDGNPHLAYFQGSGELRHAHSIGGASWEATSVAVSSGEPPTGSPSIALDSDGVHHIAWETADGIAYSTNAGGEFVGIDPPPGSAGGVLPRLAAGPEGVIYLAWYDPEGTEVMLGVKGGEEPLLAVPTNAPSAAPTAQPTGPPPCEPSGAGLTVAASGSAFDTDCLAAPAGEPFTIAFDNQDAALQHNVGIYTAPAGEELFKGDFVTGETITYQVGALEAGQLYFQCDVHPTTMSGTFVVA